MKTRALSQLAAYILTAIYIAGSCLGQLAPPASAQVVTEGSTVTAFVADYIPPSTPILIAPDDGSTVNTATPTFVWQESTDTVAMGSYTLTLDGDVLFENIPLASTNHSDYILVYNNSDDTYSLTPDDSLSNGTHTWKITAYDSSGNYTDSVTWTFTIDTQAPVFVITQIGDESVSISSQDVSTIPDEPIILEDNEPLIAGTGESDADVEMTVTIPNEPTQTFNFTIGGSGTWSVQLGVLPRGVTMYLDFTITDEAGNVSVLQDVPFQIEQIIIIFPPQSSPTPVPTPQSSPLPSGASPEPTQTPPTSPTVPIPTPAGPIISIPYTPPRETVIRVAQKVDQALPPFVRDAIEALPEGLREAISEPFRQAAPAAALLATAAIPTLSFLNLILEFGGQLTWRLLIKILQAIGLIPPSEPQGLVFNSETYEPVSYALLTFRSTHQDIAEQILETAISDENGVYQGITLPTGEYTLSVDHQDYHFPTTLPRPSYLSLQEFYKGETFAINSQANQPLFLIPADSNLVEHRRKTWRDRLRLFVARFKLRNLVVPLFIFSCLVTLFYPSTLNYVILSLYIALFVRRAFIAWRIPVIAGTITDSSGEAIENAIIRVTDEQTGLTKVLTRSNQNGQFATRIERGIYQIAVSKNGYVWVENNEIVPYMEATADRSGNELSITLKPIQEVIVPQ